MGKEAFGLEVRSGLELFDEEADALVVVGRGELGNSEGQGDAVEVGVGGKGGGAADVEDAFWVRFGFEEGEGRA